MHSTDVIKQVTERLNELGVGKHVRSVKKIPCKVKLEVFIAKRLRTWELRTGITSGELDQKLTELSNAWHLAQQGQRDIEDPPR